MCIRDRGILKKTRPTRPPPPIVRFNKPRTTEEGTVTIQEEKTPRDTNIKNSRNKPEASEKETKPLSTRRKLVISAIILSIICGAATFGGIMSYQEHNQHKDKNQTEAYKPPQRLPRETRRNKTDDEVRELIRDGTKKKERMNMQDIELYHGRKTIRIFTDQVTTVAVHQNLGNLVVKLENSIK